MRGLKDFAPLFAVLLIYAIGDLAGYRAFGFDAPELTGLGYARNSTSDVFGHEAQARLMLATTLLVLVVAAAVAIAVACHTICAMRRSAEDRWLAVLLATAVALVAFVIEQSVFRTPLYETLFGTLYAESVGAYLGGLGLLDRSLWVANLASIAATAFVAIAACTLAPSIWNASRKRGRRARRAVVHLKRLLLAGAAVLVAGILEMKAWLNWPLPLMPEEFAKQYEAFVLGVSTQQATVFTLILAAIFVIALFQIGRAPGGAHGIAQAGGLTTRQLLEQILKIVAPLLAGPLPTLIGQVFSNP